MFMPKGVHGNMPHFAKISDSNIVEKVEVFSQEDVNANGGDYSSGVEAWVSSYKGGGTWKQTSYNSNFRKQFAGIDFTYDATKDKFIAPKPAASWALDDNDDWQAPITYPSDGKVYIWNETAYQADNTTGWDLFE